MDPLKTNQLVKDVLDKATPRQEGDKGTRASEEYKGDRVVFVGLLGDPVTQPSDGKWTLLYRDLALTTWLLVEPDAVLNHLEIEDRDTPSVTWNALWVKATASVGHGSGPVSDATFLTGNFIRASDFPSTPAGGTFGGPAGVFQVGTSPNCCTRKSK